jgi:hypothetical protein
MLWPPPRLVLLCPILDDVKIPTLLDYIKLSRIHLLL